MNSIFYFVFYILYLSSFLTISDFILASEARDGNPRRFVTEDVKYSAINLPYLVDIKFHENINGHSCYRTLTLKNMLAVDKMK